MQLANKRGDALQNMDNDPVLVRLYKKYTSEARKVKRKNFFKKSLVRISKHKTVFPSLCRSVEREIVYFLSAFFPIRGTFLFISCECCESNFLSSPFVSKDIVFIDFSLLTTAVARRRAVPLFVPEARQSRAPRSRNLRWASQGKDGTNKMDSTGRGGQRPNIWFSGNAVTYFA